VYLNLGDGAGALIELRKGREIMARLVIIAPSNAIWQREVTWFDGQIAGLEAQTQEAGRN
jgi:hypothetical protein